MDSYDKDTTIEIYVEWLTTSTVTFAKEIKIDGKGYGFLPKHEVCSILFEECTADQTGTWTVQVHGRPYKFESLTVIDTVTNLVKLVRIKKDDSDHIMQKFKQCWLT
jgi:hypothetical protein